MIVGYSLYARNPYYATTTTSTTVIETTSITQTSGELLEYCFSPHGDCASVVVRYIDAARTSVHVLIYDFTLDTLSAALVRAKNRGVDVKVAMDKSEIGVQGGEYNALRTNGIQVALVGSGSAKMHDKVVIIDAQIIITGSFNWTVSAESRNNENLVVLRSSDWAETFEREFQSIFSTAS